MKGPWVWLSCAVVIAACGKDSSKPGGASSSSSAMKPRTDRPIALKDTVLAPSDNGISTSFELSTVSKLDGDQAVLIPFDLPGGKLVDRTVAAGDLYLEPEEGTRIDVAVGDVVIAGIRSEPRDVWRAANVTALHGDQVTVTWVGAPDPTPVSVPIDHVIAIRPHTKQMFDQAALARHVVDLTTFHDPMQGSGTYAKGDRVLVYTGDSPPGWYSGKVVAIDDAQHRPSQIAWDVVPSDSTGTDIVASKTRPVADGKAYTAVVGRGALIAPPAGADGGDAVWQAVEIIGVDGTSIKVRDAQLVEHTVALGDWAMLEDKASR